jgi:hypothetical protein
MKCIICGNYFKKHAFNQTNECDDCVHCVLPEMDSETEVDVGMILNPSGKTPAVFYQDGYESDDEESRDSI